jgi:hypothetical protein
VWTAIAAGVVVVVAVVLVVRLRRRHHHDALGYDDFVELGRAAWIDLRDDDRTRLAK